MFASVDQHGCWRVYSVVLDDNILSLPRQTRDVDCHTKMTCHRSLPYHSVSTSLLSSSQLVFTTTCPLTHTTSLIMARNGEKAQSMLYRFREAQSVELGLGNRVKGERRPRMASAVSSLRECERWRGDIMRDISRKVSKIQDGMWSAWLLVRGWEVRGC
jgi:hypothetical protein